MAVYKELGINEKKIVGCLPYKWNSVETWPIIFTENGHGISRKVTGKRSELKVHEYRNGHAS